MAETKKQTLERLYRIIDTDATAIAFQTLGQYRTFLRDTVRDMIKSCDGEPSSVPQANELLPLVIKSVCGNCDTEVEPIPLGYMCPNCACDM